VNNGEYKVMGLSAFGQPTYRDRIEKVFRQFEDGSFELDLDYFRFHSTPDRGWSPRFEELFGAPRKPDGPLEQRHKDLAASIQLVTEEAVLRLVRALHEETGENFLCMAGGVALNSVAVGRIIREGPFEDVFVQPAAGDAGTALGAALLAAGGPRVPLTHAAWGADLDPGQVRGWLEEQGAKYTEPEDIAAISAERLARGEVVGWMQGRFELGPRALGQRSILADPRDVEAKDRLNRKVKFREPFRPFAPSVLADFSPELFELPEGGSWTRRFMTSVVPARDQRIPAALHVDGTARIQEVHADATPLYARLLSELGDRTGVPCVVNTSFNLAGEPMVNSVADGFGTFVRSDIDALAVGPFLVERP